MNIKFWGVRASLGRISIENSQLGSYFFSAVHYKSGFKKRWWYAWFDVGVVLFLVSEVLVVLFLLINVLHRFYTLIISRPGLNFVDHTSIAPVIPGVNMPLGLLGYYWIAILISLIFHEAGHALAASLEHLRIQRAGFFVHWGIPGAFVQVEDAILFQSVRAQLRVHCAGVWHNLILAFAVWLLTFSVAPWFWGFVLDRGAGVTVLTVHRDSPFYGTLKPGDVLTELSGYPILRFVDIQRSAFNIMEATNAKGIVSSPCPTCHAQYFLNKGYCFPEKFLKAPQDVHLCSKTNFSCKSGLHCFQSFPDETQNSSALYTCMRVTHVAQSSAMCLTTADCISSKIPSADLVCSRPLSLQPDFILRLSFKRSTTQTVSFEGNPQILISTLELSDWSAQHNSMQLMVHFQACIHRFGCILCQVSLSVAFLNVVPLPWLDSFHVLQTLHSVSIGHLPQNRCNPSVPICVGALLLCLNFGFGLLSLAQTN